MQLGLNLHSSDDFTEKQSSNPTPYSLRFVSLPDNFESNFGTYKPKASASNEILLSAIISDVVLFLSKLISYFFIVPFGLLFKLHLKI